MLPTWTAAAVAKAKLTALLAASLVAGGVGGAVVLSHVAPTTQFVTQTAGSSDEPADEGATADPESTAAQDPETAQAQDPETAEAGDPETSEAGDPETSADPESGAAGGYTLPECPADVKNHGAYVAMVARSAPKGPHGEHGHWVSLAARSDCGKKSKHHHDPESGGSTHREGADPAGASSGSRHKSSGGAGRPGSDRPAKPAPRNSHGGDRGHGGH